MCTESAHFPTFGAEIETKTEIRSISTILYIWTDENEFFVMTESSQKTGSIAANG